MKINLLLLMACLITRSIQAQETVVLLHGLARTTRSMNKMAKALQADGYRVINHAYPSTKKPIDVLTAQAFDQLNPQISGASQVHFVTHSLGGIILRQYLETHQIQNLGRVVMLAPPNQGSEVTDKLGQLKLYQWINGPAGNQLGTGADSLPLRLKAPAFELGILAGDRSINPILSLLIPGPDDGKVAVARSHLTGATDYRCLHVTHACTMRNRRVINQTRYFLHHGQFK